VTNPKGWNRVTATNVNPIVTIADLVAVTGLSRWTVREMLTRYKVPALPRYGPRDTRRYQRQHVLAAIESMTGSGNRRSNQP
jgi:hypothetical protein